MPRLPEPDGARQAEGPPQAGAVRRGPLLVSQVPLHAKRAAIFV